MQSRLSKSQIDQLGDELRRAASNGLPLDVKRLDTYRRAFDVASEELAMQLSSHELGKFTQRTKSTPSILAKLKRQPNTRLSQIQDVLGIRFVVADWQEQEHLCGTLKIIFRGYKVVDRRMNPSFGYRAIHIMVRVDSKPVEIQIRTVFQHLWSELSEDFADKEGHDLKYGGGDMRLLAFLEKLSDNVHARELALCDAGLRLRTEQIEAEFKALLPKNTESN